LVVDGGRVGLAIVSLDFLLRWHHLAMNPMLW